jgi:hypothetical protein
VFLAESCQGDRTQRQQPVLKTANVATETGRKMQAIVYYSVRLHKSECERARNLSCDAQILPQ